MKVSNADGLHRLALDADEQITFVTPGGGEYDVAAKAWGSYLTPSLRGRLASFKLRPALIAGENGDMCLAIVDLGQVCGFLADLERRGCQLLRWLDDADLSGASTSP